MAKQKMQRADAHIHLFKNGYHAQYGEGWARNNELQCYEALRTKHDIARALVVGFEGDPQFDGNNRHLAKWGELYPWMAPLCYVNCQRIPAIATPDQPFAGLALYVSNADDIAGLTQWPERFYQNLNERRSIISINAGPAMLEKLSPFIQRLENCPILISHLGLPGKFAQEPTAATAAQALKPLCSLSQFPNVMVKTSALYAISEPAYDFPHRSALPLLRGIYAAFGADRLLWGSDFSPSLEHISFVQTIEALEVLNSSLEWPEPEMQQIRGGNLLRLLNL